VVYRDRHLLCLGCGGALARRKFRAYTTHNCERCGSVWVSQGHLREMLALMMGAGAPHPAITRAKATSLAPLRGCVECSAPMSQWQVNGERIDECAKHGIWLDGGELANVLLRAVLPHDDGDAL
jgi:Zn-finger nucleic acid-binding protein